MYRVIKLFRDLQDNNHVYHVGDSFPHDGIEVSSDRLKELSTDKNRRHTPLIEKVEVEAVEVAEEETETPKEPEEGFMNPPEEPEEKPEQPKEDAPKPKKKRGRPRNDAQ